MLLGKNLFQEIKDADRALSSVIADFPMEQSNRQAQLQRQVLIGEMHEMLRQLSNIPSDTGETKTMADQVAVVLAKYNEKQSVPSVSAATILLP